MAAGTQADPRNASKNQKRRSPMNEVMVVLICAVFVFGILDDLITRWP